MGSTVGHQSSQRVDDRPLAASKVSVVRPGRALRGLFPLAPQRPLPLAAASAALLAGTVLGLARQTGAGALDTVWAEDGAIFLEQALDSSLWHALAAPYAGYVHVVPRLLTEVVALLPLGYAAIGFAFLGALGAAALALVVYSATGGHYRSTGIRIVLAASLVLLPVARAEVLDSVVNLHWVLVPAAFWVMLSRPRRGAAVGVGTAVAALAGTSDPFALLLAPVAAGRVLALRGWRDHLVTMGWAVGIAAQALAIVVGDAPQREFTPVFDPIYLGGWYAWHVGIGAAFGDQLPIPPILLAAPTAVLAGVVATLALRTRGDGRSPALPLTALAMSLLCYLTPVALTGTTAPRYAMMPVMLLLAAAGWVIDRPEARRARIALGILVAVVWTASLPVAGPRAAGPRWSAGLEAADARCAAGASEVTVPVSPTGWDVDLDCADVLAG